VSPDALESDVQDYVDGRMAEPRRRAFELRLAEDAALARRVRALREMGAALAGGEERLSPDFYARLRSRFEQTRATPRKSRAHRWQAYGLAAAALIALALFVPQLLTHRSVEMLATATEESQTGREAPNEPAAPPPADIERQETESRSANEARPKKQDLDPKEEDLGKTSGERKLAAREPARPVPDKVYLEDRTPSAVPEPAPRDSRLDETAPIGGASQGAQEKQKDEAAAPAPRAAASEGFAPAPPPVGLTVRPGLVERDAVVEIDDRAGWERLELAALGRYDPSRRVVLVGDRDGGLDCAASRLLELEKAHEIRLSRQTRGTELDGHACAFVLPRDGRPVTVVDPQDDAP
jgi:hypothetical protein